MLVLDIPVEGGAAGATVEFIIVALSGAVALTAAWLCVWVACVGDWYVMYVITAIPTAPSLEAPAMLLPVFKREREVGAKHIVARTAAAAKSPSLKITEKVLETELSVGKSITQYAADQKTDLIVVGTSSVGGIRRFVLGSASNEIVNNAKTSVLVVR